MWRMLVVVLCVGAFSLWDVRPVDIDSRQQVDYRWTGWALPHEHSAGVGFCAAVEWASRCYNWQPDLSGRLCCLFVAYIALEEDRNRLNVSACCKRFQAIWSPSHHVSKELTIWSRVLCCRMLEFSSHWRTNKRVMIAFFFLDVILHVLLLLRVAVFFRGLTLFWKPGNVWEFCWGQGKIMKKAQSQGKVREFV